MLDSNVFGTGHHPTTALCVEALEEILTFERLDSVLDVGTGSGILALTVLMRGVPQAVGLDTDADALRVAEENARLNGLANRLELVLGGPDVVNGNWPLVVANVLAAPLMEMAPILVRRVGTRGRLILSGIPSSLESEVMRTYQHLGMRHIGSKTLSGWTMLIAQASW
jgi:ribosomal protein L11 methyltransferase